ncbi:hypothetical protein GGQ76_004114, partial [Aureimonas jatrophae]|nr:hypothetical protein [Aureimonas jatrophae]
FRLVLLLSHLGILHRLESLLQGGPLFRGQTSRSNGYNEQLRVESDDHGLFLQSMGMAARSGQRDAKLTQEGGAELFWEMLIRPLQGGRW